MSNDNTLDLDIVPVNERTDDAMVIKSYAEVVVGLINRAQYEILSGRTPKNVIKRRPGKGGKTFSYVPHGYVTAVLNKAFGFAWDFRVLPGVGGAHYEYHEERTRKLRDRNYTTPASVTVYAELIVRLHDPERPEVIVDTIIKGATGEREDSGGMTMGSLIKAAESDALKKAASKLGVALDLYWADADQDLVEPVKLTVDQMAAARALRVGSGDRPPLKATAIARELGLDVSTLLEAMPDLV